MNFSVLTYNTLFSSALDEVETVVNKYHPDIIALQEIETKEESFAQIEKYGYILADYSNSFIRRGRIFGLSTFYNKKAFKFINSYSVPLAGSFYEYITNITKIILGSAPQRSSLITSFVFKPKNKKIIVHNAHLSALSTNTIRLKQIGQALNFLKINKQLPFIIVGDFNYSYKKKQLEQIMKRYNLKEATRKVYYTFSPKKEKASYPLLSGIYFNLAKKLLPGHRKLDYIFYRNLKLIKTERINTRLSDHYPIISIFAL